ncbi:MAG: hypothetical protein AAB229_05100, partial [Candidatus Hydrogenedentota bacterium]
IGATRYLTKNFPGAIDAFASMPRFVAAANDAKWSLSNACLMDRQVDTALKIFSELKISMENNPALSNNYGVALELSGDTVGAQREYWAAIRASAPNTPRDPIALANIDRVLQGRLIDDPWKVSHRDIPLRLRGVAFPRKPMGGS